MLAKIFSIRLINFFQKRGARIHYNFMNLESGESIRYSVIDWNDFQKDLIYWNYLTVSGFMQKPINKIINEDEKLVDELQKLNLSSAVSY